MKRFFLLQSKLVQLLQQIRYLLNKSVRIPELKVGRYGMG